MVPRIRCRVRPQPARWSSVRPVEQNDYRGYHLGLHALRWLRHYFPDVFVQHVADTLLTPGTLVQACEAFLILVQRELFPLVDEFVGQWFSVSDTTPEQALRGPLLDDQAALGVLTEAAPVLLQPWPRCYGLGIQSLLDDDAPVDLLTFALWHLCDHCPWSLGLDLAAYSEHVGLSQHKLRFIHALPQVNDFGGRLEEFIALLTTTQEPTYVAIIRGGARRWLGLLYWTITRQSGVPPGPGWTCRCRSQPGLYVQRLLRVRLPLRALNAQRPLD